MFCIYCGTENSDDAVFCRSCGQRQPQQATQSSTSSDVIVLPGLPLPGAAMGDDQLPTGNVPIVEGTPTTLDTSPGQSSAQSAAYTASSDLPPSAPPRAASRVPQAPSPSDSWVRHQLEPSTSPTHHIHTVPQHAPSKGLGLTGHISRRAVIVGLTGLAVVGVAGSGIAPPSQHPTGAPPHPTISSSGAMFGFDLQRTGFNPDEHILSPTKVSRLVPYWTASTGGSVSSPVVANGVVYINSGDHKLYAFNASTGQLLWTTSTGTSIVYSSQSVASGTSNVYSSPAVANGVVYVGSHDRKLYAFNASTGQPLWTASTGDIIDSSPAVANGVVYIGSENHKLYAFNASTGQSLWTASTDGGISSPVVANGVVYVSSNDHKVYAFHLPGTVP